MDLALSRCDFEFINKKVVRGHAMADFLLQLGIELEIDEYEQKARPNEERRI